MREEPCRSISADFDRSYIHSDRLLFESFPIFSKASAFEIFCQVWLRQELILKDSDAGSLPQWRRYPLNPSDFHLPTPCTTGHRLTLNFPTLPSSPLTCRQTPQPF